MAMETVASAFYFVVYAFFDFIIYVLVDVVAKNSLRDARDEEEKRMVWLYEAMFLLLMCLPIYLLHHQPYTLFILTVLTFIYTQLQGRVNFRYWWHLLVTRWDEFQQHEASMEHLQEMQTRQAQNPAPIQPPPVSTAVSGPPMAWIPQPAPPPGNFFPVQNVLSGTPNRQFADCGMMTSNVPPATSALNTPHANQPTYSSTPVDNRFLHMIPRGSQLVRRSIHPQSGSPPRAAEPQMAPLPGNFVPAHSYVGNNPGPVSVLYTQPMSPPLYSSSPMDARYVSLMPRAAPLARRPMNSHMAPQQPTTPAPEAPNFPSRIKTSVMSALGFTLPGNPLPGLRNHGQNICFLNSVLQCLAHSPGLVDSLVFDSRRMRDSKVEAAPLVGSLAELLEHLATAPGSDKHAAFDTEELRTVASNLSGSLTVDPRSGNQSQQDAAEFLMWLLDALHTSLNFRRPPIHSSTSMPAGPAMVERHPSCPRFTAMTLNMLKFIYGDLTPPRVNELKVSCRKEIESANGLDSESYAEPIQRLSDLEWLTYKEHNNSAADDLFTGQLVEAQHCIACNRISVGIQTFNVLPVPIVEPRQLNGIVYLEDCFAKFGNIEDLFGLDGLCCETCNNQQGVQTSTPLHQGRQDIDSRTQLQQAAALAASPVLRNGGVASKTSSLPLRRPVSTSDSALHSTFGHTTIMSPIPNSGEAVNDSGFQDHHFRTSTPIRGPVAPVRLTDGQRRSLLRQLPECFIVQLMRFSYHQGQPRKLQRPVSVPLVKLDLTHLIIDNVMKREDLTALNASFRYDLYGLCLHLGSESTVCGHYISYAQASDGNWYKFDDEVVSQVNMEYELNTRQVRENAYLLFYRKSVLV